MAQVSAASTSTARPTVRGKFLWRGSQKLFIRGVTYGPFRPTADGCEYHTPEIVAKDFALMAANGINTVRVYTVPPRWLLDEAAKQGLLVFLGLPWEQHITFLDDPERVASIEQRVRDGVRQFAGHPALLGFSVGNEIPASIVRWHGRKKVEEFLKRLYRAAKEEDPGALVTYVNFPTTEYLEIGFFDFVCFNVYLEAPDRMQAYLARLQNLAGEKPLVMAEIGLDSLRNGLEKQAEMFTWQIRSVFQSGASGVFVFAWTDEWHRGGHDIDDWDFGLTTRQREKKPALAAVRAAFQGGPIERDEWPRFSVVVCSYNGSRTIRDTLDHLSVLPYPNFEVIVVSDGSTDNTGKIAAEYPIVRLIETTNQGLSSARNTGMRAANGEIIAYIDDDAYPDPHWLHYLAHAFRTSEHVAIGGPNLPPPGDGPIAECVAKSPGGPIHVLVSDDLAEHIPGCNFVVRKAALEAIGGFDPIYRAAGDDVDVCWRLQENGGTIGFHPAAMVWHHRRNSVKMYWRQQKGYGKAEALLERKWPERYNAMGHVRWEGRLYGHGVLRGIGLMSRIYHGMWNSAPFQILYQPELPLWQALPQMPEWYFVNAALIVLAMLGFSWTPLFLFAPFAILGLVLPAVQIFATVWKTPFSEPRLRWISVALFAMQPIARLYGRLQHGLTPWRERAGLGAGSGTSRHKTWSEKWRSQEEWLELLREEFRNLGVIAYPGGDYEGWDFHIRGGVLCGARLRLAIEEHGSGKQLLRWRIDRSISGWFILILVLLAVFASEALVAEAWVAASFLAAAFVLSVLRVVTECSLARSAAREALGGLEKKANETNLLLGQVVVRPE